MKLSLYEQETILLYNQAEDTAEVYTHETDGEADPPFPKAPGTGL